MSRYTCLRSNVFSFMSASSVATVWTIVRTISPREKPGSPDGAFPEPFGFVSRAHLAKSLGELSVCHIQADQFVTARHLAAPWLAGLQRGV